MSSDAPRDPRLPRFPVIVQHPTFGDVKSNMNGSDYAQWLGIGAASFPLGYVFGMKLDRHVARPSMWVTGLLGTLGGFLLAYQNSSFRLQGYARNDGEVRRYIQHTQQE